MASFDDDLDPAPPSRARRPGDPDLQRQIFVRRAIALGAGVLVIILMLLAVRGCLNERKQRGFENYASDLDSVVATSNQLSSEFFGRLLTPPAGAKGDPLNLESDIASDRGTAQGLLSRVQGLDMPDELSEPQQDLERAFELRLDALTTISEQIATALGEEGRNEAIDAIASAMRALLASDVLYAIAREQMQTVFAEEEIEAEIAESAFLPPPTERWLNDEDLALILTGFAAEQCEEEGLHGLELVGVTADNAALIAGSENTVSLGGGLELEAEMTNGGESNEVDVPVSAEISGPTGVVEAETVVDRIEAGEIGEAVITFEDDPPADVPVTLEVQAGPVLCEQVLDNNSLTYTVTFE